MVGPRLGGLAVEVGDLDAVAGDRDDLVLAELERLAGVLDERGDVGGEEVLALADADDERAVAAGGDHPVGVLGVDRDQGERAVQAAADLLHRLGERAARLQRRLDEVRRDLGVGLGDQLVPGGLDLRRSAAKFSMIPLCTRATRPAAPRCGWALRSLGAPCVAQRVCPMPVQASGSGWSASALSRFASLPARFSEAILPSCTRAIPAES